MFRRSLGQIGDFLPELPYPPGIGLLTHRGRHLLCVQFAEQHRNPLEHVIVNFSGHEGAFLLLGGEEAVAEGTDRRHVPSLLQQDGDDERYDEDRNGAGGGEIDPPNVRDDRPHRTPRVKSAYARILMAAFT